MGMVVVSSTIAAGPIAQTLSTRGKPIGDAADRSSAPFALADDFAWWMEAASAQRARRRPAVLSASRFGVQRS